jgi:hypothetical protein
MTQKCVICNKGAVSCGVPVDPRNEKEGYYAVCSSSRCKFVAWAIPIPKNKELKA